MNQAEYLIIGFGKGGKTLAATLGAKGHTVILFEESPQMYGGTCINVACIPTKALVEQAALSAKLGGNYEERNARYQAAIEKKGVLTGKLRDKNYHKLADNPLIKVIDGKASFVDAHHVLCEWRHLRRRDHHHQYRRSAVRSASSRHSFEEYRCERDPPRTKNAPASSSHRRRGLYRPRIRLDVPQFRKRSHDACKSNRLSWLGKTRSSPQAIEADFAKRGLEAL
jgi:choline dehydrogenase-like flavoprotein